MSAEPQQASDFIAAFRKAWGIVEREKVKPQTQEEIDAKIRALVERQRMENFRRFAPPEFVQKIDRTKIPNLKAWDLADSWEGTFPGRWLWSHETGEAKTRMLWKKFGQFHVRKGMSVQRVTGLNLAEDYHDAYNKSRTANFYRDLCSTDVLMLDDLDKMPLPSPKAGFSESDNSRRNARMLRELFDSLYEDHSIVLVTSNEPIAWFAERIGESAERRMRAVCTEIQF